VELLKTLYGWGLTDFDFNPIMATIQGFFVAKGIAASIEVDNGATADSFGFTQDTINPRPVLNVPLYSFYLSGQYYELGFQLFKYIYDQKAGLLLQPLFPSSVSQTLAINSDTSLV